MQYDYDAPETADQIAEQFRRDGLVLLELFYPLDQMNKLATALDEIVAADPDREFGGGPDYARVCDTRVQVYSGKDCPEILQAMRLPILHHISEAICGPDYKMGGEGIFSTPHGCGQGWHQDTRSREPDQYELNRIIFPRDVDPAQGCLYYVPGSHLGPDLPPGGNHESLPNEVAVTPKAGTLALMHTRCFHRVGVNQNEQRRTQCNSRTRPATAAEGLGDTPVFRVGPWTFSTGKQE